jgi:uncharacterized protein YcbK (DUF882 family)
MTLPRRAFLRMGGAAIASTLTSSLAVPAFASPALVGLKDTNSRVLSFDNLHTGEKLKVDYWADGNYVPDALASVNKVLRDWRTGDIHVIEPKLLDLLNLLGKKLESNAGFQVICGYRSPATNTMLHETTSGVASNSLHLLGKAIDIKVADRSLDKVHQTALAMAVGGVGYYPTSDFVHVDVGAVRHWAG